MKTPEERKATKSAYGRKYRETHREEERERKRKWCEANREHHRKQNREWQRTHPEAHRKYRYGITDVDYEQMLARQGGVCAICGGNNQNKKILGIDHDHSTKTVRGLLCDKCNLAIGYMNDDPDLLQRAVDYIRRSRLCTK